MKRNLFLISIISLIGAPVWAQVSKAGQAGAKFLSLSYSVRGASLGDAFSAVGNDPSVAFHNPAGIALISRNSLYLQGGLWWENYVTAVSYVKPTKRGNLYFMLSGIYVGGIDAYELTSDAQIISRGEISYLASQLGFGYATFLTDKFAFGVGAKLIYEGFGGYSTAYSVAIDAGTYYYTGFKDFVIASNFRHFGFDLKPTGTYVSYQYDNGLVDTVKSYTSYKLPTTYGIGLAGTIYKNAYGRLKVSFEITHPVDNLEYYSIGGEYVLMNMLYIRAGYRFYVNSEEAVNGANGINLGIGLKYGKFTLDYGYLNRGILPAVNLMALNVVF